MFALQMTDPEFTHYLITRFNIKISGYGPERLDSSAMDSSYLQHRLRLFEVYCFPSVKSQIEKKFCWLIYFDEHTDPEVLEHVQQLTGGEIAILLLRVPDFEHMLSDIRERIRSSPTSYVITTRLDNDDIISHNFMAAIQQHFVQSDRMVINFTKGFEIDLNLHYIKKWKDRKKNQFISLIEKRDAEKVSTIYGFPHYAIPADIPVRGIEDEYQWAYTRHSFNFSPQKINAGPVFRLKSLQSFPAVYSTFTISFSQTAVYTAKWFARKIKRKLFPEW